MTFSPSEQQTFENIENLYFGSYMKRAFHNASRMQKFFYNLSEKPAVKYTAQCLTAIPLILASKVGVWGAIGITWSVGILQNSIAQKWGITPIQNKAKELFAEGMLSGEIFNSYAQLIHQDGVNNIQNLKNKIYSPEHEMIRLNSLMKTFNNQNAQNNTTANTGIKTGYTKPSQQR